jgi:hypothetical protein
MGCVVGRSAPPEGSRCVVELDGGQHPGGIQFCMVRMVGWLVSPYTASLTSTRFIPSAAIPALEKTQGYVVALSSVGAQLRFPGISDANISKHAVNRLIEFVALGKIVSLCLARVPT